MRGDRQDGIEVLDRQRNRDKLFAEKLGAQYADRQVYIGYAIPPSNKETIGTPFGPNSKCFFNHGA
jgi:hypothetical protein